MGKITEIKLNPMQQSTLEDGYRNGPSHAFRMRCKVVLLKAQGLSSPQIGECLEMHQTTVNNWVRRFEEEGIKGLCTRPGRRRKPIIGTQDEENIRQAIEKDRSSVLTAKAQWESATGKTACEEMLRRFFKRIARFGRIGKRPKGKPSPQLYRYKLWELQELERLWHNGSIDLYYGDESHICEEAYVPYGWKFSKEDVYIPSQRGARINCFAMIDRRCHIHWFTTGKSIDADTMIGFLDNFSMTVRHKTVIVLDNAPIHRAKRLLALRDIWEKRGLHLFFLPPYSPQLNIAEILWRMLKGKWLQPKDYLTADTLFYAANRALAAMGDGLMINFKYYAA